MINRIELFNRWKRERTRESLVALLAGCQDTVYSLCFQVLRHPQDAEDASQKVFLDLLGVIPVFTDPDHFGAWLHRACLLTALNLRRSERRRMRYEKTPRADSPASISDEDLAVLHERLARLHAGARTLLVDHYFECRTLEDLARSRGCSTVAVWKQIQKAKEALGRSLSGAGCASLTAALGVFLENRRLEAAPDSLLSEGVLAKAASVVRAPATLAGGTLSLLKTAASIGAMALLACWLVGYSLGPRREISKGESEKSARRKTLHAPPSETLNGPSNVGGDPRILRLETEEPGVLFESFPAFRAAFRKACAVSPDSERWRALRRIGLRRSDLELCADLAPAHIKKGVWRDLDAALRIILRGWMESNTGEVAAFLGSMPLSKTPVEWDSWSFSRPLVEAWSLENPAGALALLQSLPPGWPTQEAVRETQWRVRLASDPEGFLQWLRTESAGEERSKAMNIGIPYWTSKDPLAAAAWVEQLPAEVGKIPLGAVAREWARSSPEAALAWARKYLERGGERPMNPGDSKWSVRGIVLRGLLEGAAINDPEWAVAAAQRWDNEFYFASIGLLEWSSRDAASVVRFVDQGKISDPAREAETIRRATREWARSDPKAAVKWINTSSGGRLQGQCVEDVFSEWAMEEYSDPREIYEAIGTLPAQHRTAAVNGLFGGWAQYDPEGAARFMDAIPPGGAMPTSVTAIVREWSSRDLEASLRWVRKMPPETRDYALRDTSSTLALSLDVKTAMKVAMEISDERTKRDAQGQVLELGAIYQPQAAAAVLATMSDPGSKAYRAVADGFMRRDPVAGLAWAQTLPEIYREVPSAANSLSKFFDHPLRANLTKDMLRSYANRDVEGATRWVQQASLPAASKDALLDEIQKERR